MWVRPVGPCIATPWDLLVSQREGQWETVELVYTYEVGSWATTEPTS